MSWAWALARSRPQVFQRQLGFREYARYLSFHFPFTCERGLLERACHFPWLPDADAFQAWRQGATGYPLVDAGMRQLWATGWQHNRIRQPPSIHLTPILPFSLTACRAWPLPDSRGHARRRLVAAFLCKHLLVPWQWGLKHYWVSILCRALHCIVHITPAAGICL